MPAELPITCSLSATELPARLAEMADLGRAALIGAEVEGSRARLRFSADASVRARVNTVVAAEARCCAFLTMTVAGHPDGVMLTIDAPADAQPVVAELVNAFIADHPPV